MPSFLRGALYSGADIKPKIKTRGPSGIYLYLFIYIW